MNSAELRDKFQVLFEDLATNGSKGLDEYEMSLCYTDTQREIVKAAIGANQFESISKIIKFQSETLFIPGNYPTSFKVPKTVAIAILDGRLEKAGEPNITIDTKRVEIKVIHKLYEQPYKYPPKGLAYVVVGEDAIEVFPPLNFMQSVYKYRYAAVPTPVILSDLTLLTPAVSIEGLTAETLPILDDSIYDAYVLATVKYAIRRYVGEPNTKEQKR